MIYREYFEVDDVKYSHFSLISTIRIVRCSYMTPTHLIYYIINVSDIKRCIEHQYDEHRCNYFISTYSNAIDNYSALSMMYRDRWSRFKYEILLSTDRFTITTGTQII